MEINKMYNIKTIENNIKTLFTDLGITHKIFNIKSDIDNNIIHIRTKKLNGYEIKSLNQYAVYWDCKSFMGDIVDFRIKPKYV